MDVKAGAVFGFGLVRARVALPQAALPQEVNLRCVSPASERW